MELGLPFLGVQSLFMPRSLKGHFGSNSLFFCIDRIRGGGATERGLKFIKNIILYKNIIRFNSRFFLKKQVISFGNNPLLY